MGKLKDYQVRLVKELMRQVKANPTISIKVRAGIGK